VYLAAMPCQNVMQGLAAASNLVKHISQQNHWLLSHDNVWPPSSTYFGTSPPTSCHTTLGCSAEPRRGLHVSICSKGTRTHLEPTWLVDSCESRGVPPPEVFHMEGIGGSHNDVGLADEEEQRKKDMEAAHEEEAAEQKTLQGPVSFPYTVAFGIPLLPLNLSPVMAPLSGEVSLSVLHRLTHRRCLRVYEDFP
jgi:hypothetical protein